MPLPHTVVEVVDLDDGETILAPNQIGEICFRGPQVMKGYWNRPDENDRVFRGGRFHTGDIGCLDDGGFVKLVDRKKDMIITGGFNVFPSQVEEAILEHPGVSEAAVVGLPERDLGQVGKAYIVPAKGHPAPTYRELRRFLGARLATYEIPAFLEICDELPRTVVGKIARRQLV